MAVFKDEDEVYSFLAGIFRRGLEKDGLGDKLANSGVVLRVHYTDPNAVVTVDMPNKVVETGAASPARCPMSSCSCRRTRGTSFGWGR